MSRIHGGIHFMSDNVEALQVGGDVGRYVVQHESLPLRSGKVAAISGRSLMNPGSSIESAVSPLAVVKQSGPT
jgi:hypothetical protein